MQCPVFAVKFGIALSFLASCSKVSPSTNNEFEYMTGTMRRSNFAIARVLTPQECTIQKIELGIISSAYYLSSPELPDPAGHATSAYHRTAKLYQEPKLPCEYCGNL
ncbi:hypothetical protein TUN199_06162 [Pyrenophora tritici-repentis]|nr:hypothetical protein Alg130_05967 [Pyrenophora tritici-repentis]KAI0609849.1 hypothetical protein TUN205_05912 [Pyrenophora tritici-repentis]KAI0621854.1 hypothetical protein TUN199_06162 [Pyrenophora tritici-repentis]